MTSATKVIGYLPNGEEWTEGDEQIRRKVIASSVDRQVAKLREVSAWAHGEGLTALGASLADQATSLEKFLGTESAYSRRSAVRYVNYKVV